MIDELLPFGGFFVHFDLAGLNLRPGAGSGIPLRNILSFEAFLFQPAVRCGGSQLILFRRAVASAK
jgi:hypothetical protein